MVEDLRALKLQEGFINSPIGSALIFWMQTLGKYLMKKSLVAFTLFGALAGTASAQMNVSVYGLANAGIQRTDSDATGTSWTMDSGMLSGSGSRLGFKGSEDLGGGLSAIFTLENGFLMDNGIFVQSGRLFDRQAWVGLSGDFGTVKLGRQYTPIFTVIDAIDPFNTGIIGGNTGTIAVFDPHGVRMNNTINYSTSDFDGFAGQIAYGFGEVAGRFANNREVGASVEYTNGPLKAAVAYHRSDIDLVDFPAPIETKTGLVGITYDFGTLKGHVAYARNRGEGTSSSGTSRSRDGMIGISAPIGPSGTVLASFTRHDGRSAEGDANFWGVGYTHNISRRTNLYTSYSRAKSDFVSRVGFLAGGNDVNWFNVGIRHTF